MCSPWVLRVTVLVAAAALAMAQENDAIKDITATMRKKHAIEGKLEVVKAVEDITAIAADGPKVTRLDIRPDVKGWYTFFFANVDDKQFAYQTRVIRLHVTDAAEEAQTTLSPDPEVWDNLRFGMATAKPGKAVQVHWSFNVGMGGPAGWELITVRYSEKAPMAGM